MFLLLFAKKPKRDMKYVRSLKYSTFLCEANVISYVNFSTTAYKVLTTGKYQEFNLSSELLGNSEYKNYPYNTLNNVFTWIFQGKEINSKHVSPREINRSPFGPPFLGEY